MRGIGVQPEKRKNRPIDNSLDEAVDLETLHRDEYDEDYADYDEEEAAHAYYEKRKHDAAFAYDRRCQRRKKRIFLAIGIALAAAFSMSFAVRSSMMDTSGVSQSAKQLASSLAPSLAHGLSSVLVPVLTGVVPLLVIVFGAFFVMRLMRRYFHD